MMSAGIYNILAEEGATFSRTITWRDSNDALVNLSGYSARMQVRPTIDDSGQTATLSLTTDNGRILLGGTAGTVTLTVSAGDMTVPEGQYVYDLEMLSSGGVTVTRLLQGTFVVSGEVTK
jgi:hypothetical protein